MALLHKLKIKMVNLMDSKGFKDKNVNLAALLLTVAKFLTQLVMEHS